MRLELAVVALGSNVGVLEVEHELVKGLLNGNS